MIRKSHFVTAGLLGLCSSAAPQAGSAIDVVYPIEFPPSVATAGLTIHIAATEEARFQVLIDEVSVGQFSTGDTLEMLVPSGVRTIGIQPEKSEFVTANGRGEVVSEFGPVEEARFRAEGGEMYSVTLPDFVRALRDVSQEVEERTAEPAEDATNESADERSGVRVQTDATTVDIPIPFLDIDVDTRRR